MNVPFFCGLGCVVLVLAGCTPLAGRELRAAPSSLACMRQVLAEKVDPALQGDRAHCVAAGLVARYCSRSEAWMASVGKEITDAVGPGDAQWRDLRADRRGVACANGAASDSAVLACCSEADATAAGEPRN